MQPAAPPVPAAAVVIPEGAGQEINAGGIPGLLRVHPGWCHGALLVHEQVIPPGRLVRAHWHADVAQWSIVTRGSLAFRVGDAEHLIGPGGFIWRPPALVHAVWNPGPGPARQVEGNMPGGDMLRFYERLAELAAGQASAEEIAAIAGEHGTYYNDDLTAQLERDHQVSAAGGQR
jgi:mannose-6-phosphate isomerase-like protein (cupin superfamily)